MICIYDICIYVWFVHIEGINAVHEYGDIFHNLRLAKQLFSIFEVWVLYHTLRAC